MAQNPQRVVNCKGLLIKQYMVGACRCAIYFPGVINSSWWLHFCSGVVALVAVFLWIERMLILPLDTIDGSEIGLENQLKSYYLPGFWSQLFVWDFSHQQYVVSFGWLFISLFTVCKTLVFLQTDLFLMVNTGESSFIQPSWKWKLVIFFWRRSSNNTPMFHWTMIMGGRVVAIFGRFGKDLPSLKVLYSCRKLWGVTPTTLPKVTYLGQSLGSSLVPKQHSWVW